MKFTNFLSQSKELCSKKMVKCGIIFAAATLIGTSLASCGAISKIQKKPYIEEIEAYLTYIAEENDDVEAFVTDAYCGGNFDSGLCTEDAKEINEMIFEAMFKQMRDPDMGYGYGYNSGSSKGSWEDYIEESEIERFYKNMDKAYGDWELTYEIGESKELSGSKLKKLENILEDIADEYDDVKSELSSKDDKKEVKEFIKSIEELKIKEAYEVEVELKVDGDEESFDDTVEFVVAKLNKEWVILEGPSFYDISRP